MGKDVHEWNFLKSTRPNIESPKAEGLFFSIPYARIIPATKPGSKTAWKPRGTTGRVFGAGPFSHGPPFLPINPNIAPIPTPIR